MTRKVSAEVDLVHQQTQNQRYGSSHIGATAKDISNVVTDAASGVVDIRNILCSSRSEERFSRNAETDLVCRLLLEKKNNKIIVQRHYTRINTQHTSQTARGSS